jgi:hypothetical protein
VLTSAIADLEDPVTIDRTIARAAGALRSWRRRLRTDADRAAGEVWFEGTRDVTTRTAFEWASALAATDPLRMPFRRWIYRLTLARVAQPAVVAAERGRQIREIRTELPEPAVVSVRDVVRQAIADPVEARREQWIGALRGRTGALEIAERDVAEVRAEISSRLGVADPVEMTAVCGRRAIVQQAGDLLKRTNDLSKAVFGPGKTLAGLLSILIARDVAGTWPVRLSERWLGDLFRATKLLEGLSMDLGPLPPTVGASSFMRGLARFGAAYSRAASDRAGPFVLSNDATDTRALRRGALFAMLLLDPIFLKKKLGFSETVSGSVARALGRTVLGAVRLQAVRCSTAAPRSSPAEIADAMQAAWSVPAAPWLSGIVPRACHEAPSRLLAVLLAARDRDALVDAFDEDWFDNPRAVDWLRGQDAAPCAAALEDTELGGLARSFADRIEEIAI